MKKTLRLFLLALLAIVTNGALAQDILWSEDFSNYSENDVPSGGVNNYSCEGSGTKIYAQKLAGGDSPELLIAKNSGSFSTTINLNGKSGEMVLAFKANKNLLSVKIDDTDVVLGEVVPSGNDYSYPITVPSGKTSITIIFSNTSTKTNTRFDDAKLYQGVAKKPAGLSWGTASREVTIGSADNKFPVLTNANNLPVKYSSSDETVATINAEGIVTLVSAGKSDITATFEGNDEYESAEVIYALTVKDAPTVDISNTPETAYTVALANELITANEGLSTKVYVKGFITEISEISTSYGNATYTISDTKTAENSLLVYRGYSLEGEKFTTADEIEVGDEVVVYGQLMNYSGTYELGTGNILYSINGITTAISNITTDVIDANVPIYNLAGQRVSKDTKGILIQNGKKFVNNK